MALHGNARPRRTKNVPLFAAGDPKVKVDAKVKRSWDEPFATLEQAQARGSKAFDVRWETVEAQGAINRGDGEERVIGRPPVALSEFVTGANASGPSATIPARQARVFVKK